MESPSGRTSQFPVAGHGSKPLPELPLAVPELPPESANVVLEPPESAPELPEPLLASVELAAELLEPSGGTVEPRLAPELEPGPPPGSPLGNHPVLVPQLAMARVPVRRMMSARRGSKNDFL